MTKAYCFTNFGSGLSGQPVSTIGVNPGDLISLHTYLSSSTGAATGMSIQLEYYNSSGTLISTTQSNVVSSTTTKTSAFIDGDTVPAGTAYIGCAVNYTASGDTVHCDYGNLTPTPMHVIGSSTPTIDLANPNHANQLSYGYNSTPVQATVSSSPDTNGNYLQGGSTSSLVDDAGLSQSSTWGLTSSTPTNIAGYGITDAQQLIANATDTGMVLRRDNGGTIYCGYQYTGETNIVALGGTDMFPNGDLTLTTSFVTFGNTINIPNPGQSVVVAVSADVGYYASGGTGDDCAHQVQISFDGGATWQTSTQEGSTRIFALSEVHSSTCCYFMYAGTPTDDIQVRIQCAKSGSNGTDHAQAATSGIEIKVFQNSTYSIAGNLSSTLASTASMNCTSNYPTSSCTASKTLTVTVGGGAPPYSYSWTKVSGTGSITSGATAKTSTTSDTETTTSGGATHTTTVKCSITDSQVYPLTTPFAAWASSVATLTIGTHSIPVGAVIVVSGITPSGYNGTFTVTAVTSTTVSYALASNPGAYSSKTGTNQITSVTVTSGNCVITGTFTLIYAAISPSMSATGGSCSTGTNPGTCTASGSFSVTATGGNGSYTYSNSITSQTAGYSASITSGATSSSGHVAGSATTTPIPGNTDTVHLQTSVNDTRGTGAQTSTAQLGLKYSYVV